MITQLIPFTLKIFQYFGSFDKDVKSISKRYSIILKKKPPLQIAVIRCLKINEIILRDCSLNLVNPPADFKPLEGIYQVNGTFRLKEDNIFHLSESLIELPMGRGKIYPEIIIDLKEDLKLTGLSNLELFLELRLFIDFRINL
jgi:hypothetical protein